MAQKGGEDRILRKDGSGLLKSFTDKFKKALGPSSEEILAEENQEVRELRQKQNEAEKQLKEEEQQILLEQKTAENVQHLRSRLEQTQAKIAALEEEHGSTLENQNEINRLKQLEKNLKSDLKDEEKKLKEVQKKQKEQDKEKAKLQTNVDQLGTSLSTKVKERNDTEAGLNRTKPLDELEERYETLKREIEEDRRIINDENASPSEKQAAADRIAEKEEEMERLAPQVQERKKLFLCVRGLKISSRNMAGHCKRLFWLPA